MGHRDAPATVRFVAPADWSIVSALPETPDTAVYASANYDALVDAPTWLGAVEPHRFDVEGKPHILALDRPRRFSADSIERFTARLARVIATQSAIFGGLPYDKFVFFFLSDPAESSVSGLEHLNSIVGMGQTVLGGQLGVAHEFFHLWNVKRIRPAEMWPYDYSRPNETASLWVSEGITRYYADLTMYRAGFWPDTVFLEQLAQIIGSLEGNSAGRYFSASDASLSTWLDYGAGRAGGISYYFQGQVLGALLDLSILHDTRGKRGLDDVMRSLYRDFYRRNKGFTPSDLVPTVSEVAGKSYEDFFRRYVTGVDVPDYDRVLGFAGVRLSRRQRLVGFLGARHSVVAGGVRLDDVRPGGPAHLAGLRTGDVIVAADGVPAERVRLPYGCCITVDKGIERVVFSVVRDRVRYHIPVILIMGPSADTAELDPDATPGQLLVRRAWLARQ